MALYGFSTPHTRCSKHCSQNSIPPHFVPLGEPHKLEISSDSKKPRFPKKTHISHWNLGFLGYIHWRNPPVFISHISPIKTLGRSLSVETPLATWMGCGRSGLLDNVLKGADLERPVKPVKRSRATHPLLGTSGYHTQSSTALGHKLRLPGPGSW